MTLKSCFLIIFLFMSQALAKNFGQIHNVFDIKEERFLTMISRQMKNLDLGKFNQKWHDGMLHEIKNPKGRILPSATSYKSHMIDVNFTLEQDIVSNDGQIVHRKGTVVNPLDSLDLRYRLFLIDELKESQVKWLLNQDLKNEDKIILINGSPSRLGEQLKRKIFFDQTGEIIQKFKIKALPSIISQKEKAIIVEEYEAQ